MQSNLTSCLGVMADLSLVDYVLLYPYPEKYLCPVVLNVLLIASYRPGVPGTSPNVSVDFSSLI